MARYALETIPDPSVDDALRDALGKVQGRPRLGVIGSLGVRRDAKAVDCPGRTAEGHRRRHGPGGCPRTWAISARPPLPKPWRMRCPAHRAATSRRSAKVFFRCAEALAADGQSAPSRARSTTDFAVWRQRRRSSPRGGPCAARSWRAARQGVPLLAEAIRGSDHALAAAAVRAAMELPGPEITDALLAELPKAPTERQGLLILALADRHEPRVLPAVLKAAQSGDGQLRILALRALKRVGDASCVPALLDAAVEGGEDVSQAAMEALESLQDKAVDEQLAARLSQAKGKARMVLIELAGRRHAAAAAPVLWLAADDEDPAVRAAALAAWAP